MARRRLRPERLFHTLALVFGGTCTYHIFAEEFEMIPVYYSPDYVGAGYAFDTTRKAAWVADSLVASVRSLIEAAS